MLQVVYFEKRAILAYDFAFIMPMHVNLISGRSFFQCSLTISWHKCFMPPPPLLV